MPPVTPTEHKSSQQLNKERRNLENCLIPLSDFYMQ